MKVEPLHGCRWGELRSPRVIAVLLAGLLALIGPVARAAADSSGSEAAGSAPFAADATLLKSMLRDWFSAFSAENYAAIDRYFAAPFTLVGQKTVVLEDMTAVRDVWRRTREGLNGTPYAHTEALAIRVIPRSPTQAMLNIHWRRVNRDGSTQSEGAEFYLATKDSGRWLFNGNISQQLAAYGALAELGCDSSSAAAR